MTLIESPLAAIESLKPGEIFTYTQIAKKFGVDQSTLGRRHRRLTGPHSAKVVNQQKLNPQQEEELAVYIDKLTERRLQPSRDMIRNFASSVAREPVSDSWVTRFRHTHQERLIPR